MPLDCDIVIEGLRERIVSVVLKTYEVKLTDSENRLKDFKLKNFSVTGVSNQDYFARTSTLAEEVGKLRMNLAAAEQSRDALKRELSSEDPQLPPELAAAMTPPQVPSEVDTRLDAQRRQLDDLLRRYTDDHPDVISARRIIGQLEQKKSQQEADERAKVLQRIQESLARFLETERKEDLPQAVALIEWFLNGTTS